MSLWPSRRPGDAGVQRLQERCARTLDPAVLGEEIRAAAAAGELDPAVPWERVAVRPVAIRRDRFVARVNAADTRGRTVELIAKGYWDDERAARVLANHRRLWNTGLGGEGGLVRTSRPFGLLAPLGVVLTERLPGEHPPPADLAAAERVARAAALLHACPAELEPRVDMDAALSNLERRARLLERRAPTAGARALELADRARAAAGGLAPECLAPVNGDLSVSSFLLEGDRTYLLDWDVACSFDPAWDLGHYLLQLFRLGHGQGVDTAAAGRRFLAAYRAEAGVDDGSLPERVAFYEGVVAIHKAFTVSAGGGAGAPSLVDALLDLAAARLGAR